MPKGVERRTYSNEITLEEADKRKAINKLRQPLPNYWKSKEGEAEFRKVGIASYPSNNWDLSYAEFIERTPDTKGNEYAHLNRTIITGIVRRQIAPGKEVLTWDDCTIRYSPLGVAEWKNRSGLGKYPIITMQNRVVLQDSGLKDIITEPTGATKTGYSLEYNLKNIDKLHEQAIDSEEYIEAIDANIQTRYALYSDRRRMTYSIKNWDDFRDGDFDDLYEHGIKTTTAEQREQIKQEFERKRLEAEKQKLQELTRRV